MTSLLFITIISLGLATSAHGQFWTIQTESPTPAGQLRGKCYPFLKIIISFWKLPAHRCISISSLCQCAWMKNRWSVRGANFSCSTRGTLLLVGDRVVSGVTQTLCDSPFNRWFAFVWVLHWPKTAASGICCLLSCTLKKKKKKIHTCAKERDANLDLITSVRQYWVTWNACRQKTKPQKLALAVMQRLLQPQAKDCSKNTSPAVMSGKLRLGAGSSNVWHSTHFQQPHTLTRCTSTPCLSFPSKEKAGSCARDAWCFRSLLLTCIWVRPARLFRSPFIGHVRSALSAFLTPPGSGALWAPWHQWGSDLPP